MGCCKAEKRKTSVRVYKTGINVNLTIISEELVSTNITSQKENNNNTKSATSSTTLSAVTHINRLQRGARNHTVSEKRRLCTYDSDFAKCSMIFKILSL